MVGGAEEEGEGCLKTTVGPGADGPSVRASAEEGEAMKRSTGIALGLLCFVGLSLLKTSRAEESFHATLTSNLLF